MCKCNLLTPNHKLQLYQVNFNIVSDFPLALWTTSRALEAGPFKLRVTLNSSSSLVTSPHSLERRETQWSCPTADAHDLCHTFNAGHVTCFLWVKAGGAWQWILWALFLNLRAEGLWQPEKNASLMGGRSRWCVGYQVRCSGSIILCDGANSQFGQGVLNVVTVCLRMTRGRTTLILGSRWALCKLPGSCDKGSL